MHGNRFSKTGNPLPPSGGPTPRGRPEAMPMRRFLGWHTLCSMEACLCPRDIRHMDMPYSNLKTALGQRE